MLIQPIFSIMDLFHSVILRQIFPSYLKDEADLDSITSQIQVQWERARDPRSRLISSY